MNTAQFEQFMASFQQMMQPIAQQGQALQQFLQRQNGQQGNSTALTNAATLASSLDARIGKFAYDPESGFTFEHWYKRYGKFIEEDGKDLEEATKVRLLVGKLADPEYARFADSILPKVPDELDFEDVVKRLKELFGDTRSLFVRRFECFKLKQSAHQDVASFLAQVNASCENAELTLSKETLKCLIMVVGLRDEHHDLRQKCLQLLEEARKKNEDLTLEKLGEECRAYQLIRESANSLAHSGNFKEANAVHAHPQQWKERTKGKKPRAHREEKRKLEPKDNESVRSDSSDEECSACGRTGHTIRKCWHRNSTCFNCQQKGHLASMCREPKAKAKKEKQKSSRAIDTVEVGAYCMAADIGNSDWWTMPVTINGVDVDMKVDTGAQVAMLSKQTWSKLMKPKLMRPKMDIKDCNGKSMEIKGKMECLVKIGDQSPKKLEAFVSEGIRHDLIGIPWIRALSILPGKELQDRHSIGSPEEKIQGTKRRNDSSSDLDIYESNSEPEKFRADDSVQVLNFRRGRVHWLEGSVIRRLGKSFRYQVSVPALKAVVTRKAKFMRRPVAAKSDHRSAHHLETFDEPQATDFVHIGPVYIPHEPESEPD